MRLLALPLLLVTGCITASNFDSAAAARFCDSFETCNASTFNTVFTDADDCMTNSTTFFQCYQDNCETFDAKAANDCLVQFPVTADECDGSETDPTECSSAWSDCDAIPLGLCQAGVVFGL